MHTANNEGYNRRAIISDSPSFYVGGTDREGVDHSFELRNNTFGNEAFMIDQVVLSVLYDGEEVLTMDVTDQNILNQEMTDKQKVMMAAGELPYAEEDLAYQYGPIQADNNGVQMGVFSVRFTHEEAGVEVGNNDFPDYRYQIAVTLHNGQVYNFNN